MGTTIETPCNIWELYSKIRTMCFELKKVVVNLKKNLLSIMIVSNNIKVNMSKHRNKISLRFNQKNSFKQ